MREDLQLTEWSGLFVGGGGGGVLFKFVPMREQRTAKKSSAIEP